MRDRKRTSRPTRSMAGFSLIELVIVVVIIAIIGAIAIPKMSRGAAGANESALVSDLATMRAAIELYAQEHGGTYPTGSTVTAQLTSFSSSDGTTTTGTTRATPYIYGPYLKAVPPLPVGTANKGAATIIYNSAGASSASAGTGGWIYDGQTIYANSPATEVDMSGKPYQQY